jgi:hypothetical protein
LGEQNSSNTNNQNLLITKIQQEIFELREEISKQKECSKSVIIENDGAKDREDKVLNEKVELMKN